MHNIWSNARTILSKEANEKRKKNKDFSISNVQNLVRAYLLFYFFFWWAKSFVSGDILTLQKTFLLTHKEEKSKKINL